MLNAHKQLSPEQASKVAKQNLGVYTLARTLDVLRLKKQAESVQRLVKKQQDGTIGKETGGDEMPDEDETVIIGDVTITNQPVDQNIRPGNSLPLPENSPPTPSPLPAGPEPYAPFPSQTPAETQVSDTPAENDGGNVTFVTQPQKSSLLRKAAIATAITLGGAGLGAGTLALINSLNDTNTRYTLEFADTAEPIQPDQ